MNKTIQKNISVKPSVHSRQRHRRRASRWVCRALRKRGKQQRSRARSPAYTRNKRHFPTCLLRRDSRKTYTAASTQKRERCRTRTVAVRDAYLRTDVRVASEVSGRVASAVHGSIWARLGCWATAAAGQRRDRATHNGERTDSRCSSSTHTDFTVSPTPFRGPHRAMND